jgi:flagellar basal-body rod protein FlgC
MDAINKLFSGMQTSASALKAERARMDVIARNIANSRTTRVPGSDGPYRRQVVSFAPILERVNGQVRSAGVRVAGILPDYTTPFEQIYDPGHPDANAEGIVSMPNVNTMQEMADLITAVRAYEANIKVQESFERMAERALRLAE